MQFAPPPPKVGVLAKYFSENFDQSHFSKSQAFLQRGVNFYAIWVIPHINAPFLLDAFTRLYTHLHGHALLLEIQPKHATLTVCQWFVLSPFVSYYHIYDHSSYHQYDGDKTKYQCQNIQSFGFHWRNISDVRTCTGRDQKEFIYMDVYVESNVPVINSLPTIRNSLGKQNPV